MGNRIPLPVDIHPVPAGTPANFCWGPGAPFGFVPTPLRLVLRVSGIVKGPGWLAGDGEPPNEEFLIDQHPINADLWADVFPGFTAFVLFGDLTTNMVVLSSTGITAFSSNLPPRCQLFVANTVSDKFERGTARVWIPKVIT